MRRFLLCLLLTFLLCPAAQADTQYETVCPENAGLLTSVTYDQFYGRWISEFQYGADTFFGSGDYIVVENQEYLTCTYYPGTMPTTDATFADIAAFAEQTLAAEPIFHIDWANGPVLLLPGGLEVSMPPAELRYAYVRNSRLFLSLALSDGSNLLRIVTWRDGLDVLDVAIPCAFYFDDYHAGDSGDEILLCLDTPEFYEVSADYQDGRWLLGAFNTGSELYVLQENAVGLEMGRYWVYGHHPWHDLETLDFATLPSTHTEVLAHITREGWLFPTEDVLLHAAPGQEGESPYLIPADTPLPIIRTEGEWAYVGIHCAEDFVAYPVTGYAPLDKLTDEPASVLPGGEQNGWFYTMAVKDGMLTFTNLRDKYDQYLSIPVEPTFAAVAREIYRETGFAATPHRFSPALYEHIDPCVQFQETLRDVYITGDKVVLSVQNRIGQHILRIATAFKPNAFYHEFIMPGPFHFDHEALYWYDEVILLDP